jgi:hypothetical protein
VMTSKAGDDEVEVPEAHAYGSRSTPLSGTSKTNTPRGSNVEELTSEL